MKLSRSFSKLRSGKASDNTRSNNNSVRVQGCGATIGGEVKWELRPGGMLVQKRETEEESIEEGIMVIKVATGSQWHDVSIQPTSTFGKSSITITRLGYLREIIKRFF